MLKNSKKLYDYRGVNIKKTDNEIINSQKFARIREDKQTDEHISQTNRQFVSFGRLTDIQTFRQKKTGRQTGKHVGRQTVLMTDGRTEE